MSRFDRQRKLFADDGPSWCSLSDTQQHRIIDLLAELLVQYLEPDEPIAQDQPHQLEENHDT